MCVQSPVFRVHSPCPAADRQTLCFVWSSCPSPGRSSGGWTRPAAHIHTDSHFFCSFMKHLLQRSAKKKSTQILFFKTVFQPKRLNHCVLCRYHGDINLTGKKQLFRTTALKLKSNNFSVLQPGTPSNGPLCFPCGW